MLRTPHDEGGDNGICRAQGTAERHVGQRPVRAHHEHDSRHPRARHRARRSEARRARARRRHRNRRGRDPRRRSAAPTSSGRTSRPSSSRRLASEPPRRASPSSSRSATPRTMTLRRTRASTSCTSTCGVMFAPDHEAVARELARVTKPGGRLALACWTPEGGLGQMFGMMRPFLPPPPEGVGSPFAWGDEDHVRELLGDTFELEFEEHDSTLALAVRRGVLGALLHLLRPDEDGRRGARRRAPRGVPPDLGRVLRGSSRRRRGRAPPRVPAHARHASLSQPARDGQ